MHLADVIESDIDALLDDWIAQTRRVGRSAQNPEGTDHGNWARGLVNEIARKMRAAPCEWARDAKKRVT
jgi:hypothetical protein